MDVDKTAECLEGVSALAICDFISDFSGPTRFIADFLNSPGTIDKLVALSASPCLSDQALFRDSEGAFENCARNLEQAVDEKGNVCESFNHT